MTEANSSMSPKQSGKRIAVLGGGSFGTAIANICALNNNPTYLWMRDAARAALCQQVRENSHYVPGYKFAPSLIATSDLRAAVVDADIVFVSVPSSGFREVVRLIQPLVRADALLVSTTKGIEGNGFTLMSEILEQELPQHPVGVLSGPNFAKEIVEQQQTGTVIASDDANLIKTIQAVLSSGNFRVYANKDKRGVELAGALKNIYAIISGMATALGAGSNTHAMLITRSLAEMSRMGSKLGANPMTFLGLAGVGDLILTCTSDLSRNYRVGFALGHGRALDDIVTELGQVAEGVNTLQVVAQKAKQMDVYMPLVKGLYAVIFNGLPISEVAHKLMVGEQNYDVEFMGESHD
ncbi:NAD(P)H-dependent glycerol-3-phosphate dehydrogenase [Simiduia curdlanivorans]|uniref:Glycerol-3-phosphate dehydrogenase [NAD(P)+] n=1 Tax=Simiduia curdlanivorans TaxID=1492769 RepID=A0ABV8V3S2_9GAMM|nr:NAD(P)H-dependent glycerol-3-phosphate dehydrogenase [Simiduia curdlanivorans]MDN3640040.1 NAD(P)H-dependent glycerol-3-phosphate dehydrogenase [Simiduia curdlanivorans]